MSCTPLFWPPQLTVWCLSFPFFPLSFYHISLFACVHTYICNFYRIVACSLHFWIIVVHLVPCQVHSFRSVYIDLPPKFNAAYCSRPQKTYLFTYTLWMGNRPFPVFCFVSLTAPRRLHRTHLSVWLYLLVLLFLWSQLLKVWLLSQRMCSLYVFSFWFYFYLWDYYFTILWSLFTF